MKENEALMSRKNNKKRDLSCIDISEDCRWHGSKKSEASSTGGKKKKRNY